MIGLDFQTGFSPNHVSAPAQKQNLNISVLQS